MKKAYLTLLLGLSFTIGYAQITAPDTVCLNGTVNFTTPYAANSYAWSIGDVNTDPASVIGSSVLKMPHQTSSVSMQNHNGNYYGFVTNRDGSLVKLSFGSLPYVTPVSTDLGNLGTLGDSTIGLDIVKDDNGVWHGFTLDGKKLVHINFGTDLNSTPTANSMNFNSNFFYPYFITVKKYNTEWVAFVLNRGFNSITRLDFGNSLTNTPTATNLTLNFGALNNPVNMAIHQQNGDWHALVTNLGSGGGPGGADKLVRLGFGTNLKNNAPTDNNLANPNNRLNNPRAISIIADCDTLYALITNENNNKVTKIEFAGNVITGNPTGVDLGTIGIPNSETNSLSPFWYNNKLHFLGSSLDSSIYMYTNVYTLPVDGAASYSSSSFTKTLSTGGVFDVTLHCNQGSLSGATSFCKKIVVLGNIKVAIKQDKDTLVASGTVCDVYVWKLNGVLIPGASSQRYVPTQTGVYTVTGSTAGCSSTSSYQFFATGINDVLTAENIIISPNPSNGIFNINIKGINGKVLVQCYNVLGATVATQSMQANNSIAKTSVDLSNMPKGVYQLKIQSAEGNTVVKQILLQ